MNHPLLRFDGFYKSTPKQATIEAPTPSGTFSFKNYTMYRFYESGFWIRAEALDTHSSEFWLLTQLIPPEKFAQGQETGSIWLENQGKNHSFSSGYYEIEEDTLYAFFEARLMPDEDPIFSEIYSWVMERDKLITNENYVSLEFIVSELE